MRGRYFTLIAFLTASVAAQAQIISNFNTDAEGWTVTDVNGFSPETVSWNAAGGNPNGHVSATIATGQERFWNAPAKFMGNRAYTSFGETLTFDVQSSNPGTITAHHSVSGDIIIREGTFNQQLFLTLSSFPPTANTWASFSTKLDATADWRFASVGGVKATNEQIIKVLSNVSEIKIFVQHRSATTNITGRLDNVVLNVHPAPAAPPVVSSVTPLKATHGSTITINGTGFSTTAANNVVWFGGVKRIAESASATQLTVIVPFGAEYARLNVSNIATGFSGMSKSYFNPIRPGADIKVLTPGSFAPFVTTNRTAVYNTTGDLNGDGKPEFILASGNIISIFENKSTGGTLDANSFAARLDISPSAPDGFSEISTIDIDNDGKLEIFVAIRDSPDQGRTVIVPNLYTTGPITAASFGPAVDVDVPPYTSSATHAADLDGDGRPEIVSWGSSCGANPIYILLNISKPGDIKFTTPTSLSGLNSCGARFQTADLDGDGKTDLLETVSGNIRIFRNKSTPGSLSFDSPIDLVDGAATCAIGDLDNDNKPDIVFASGGLKIYKNISTPGSISLASFQSIVQIGTTANNQTKIGDFNGDGKPDVICGMNPAIGFFQNISVDGELNLGSFRAPFLIDAGISMPSEISIADFDADGRPDLVSNNGGGNSTTFIQNIATPTPEISSVTPLSGPPGSTVNISGANFSTDESEYTIYFGAAKATIVNSSPTSMEVIVPKGASYSEISIAGNGYTIFSKDFFDPTFSGGSDLTATSFATPIEKTILTSSGNINPFDFDADGKTDIVFDNNSNVGIFRNTSTTGVIDASTLANMTTVSPQGNYVMAGDFDGDGKHDLSTIGNIFRNVSSSSLPEPVSFTAGLTREGSANSPSDWAPARDLNNDGKIDILYTGTGPVIYVSANQARRGDFVGYSSNLVTFAAHFDLSKTSAAGGVTVADFDGDGFNDIIATNPGSTNLSVYLNKGLTSALTGSQFNGAVNNVISSPNANGITAGDFDLDGKPDLVVTNTINSVAASISIFRNTSTPGSISFTKQDFAAAAGVADVVFGDVDGDGRPDVVTVNENANSFSVFRNLSTPGVLNATSLAAKVDFATTSAPRKIAVADLDNDLRPEIIVTRATILAVYKNLMPLGPIISFTKQPAAAIACENGTTTFSANAMGASSLTYAWQKLNSTTSLFEDLTANATYSGVATSILTVSSIGTSNAGSYRVRVNGTGAAEKISEPSTLTVSASPGPPIASGASECKGASLKLSASGSTDGNYRWFIAPTGSQPIAGAVNSTFDTPVVFTTTTFYAAIANDDGCVSTRVPAVATIDPITKPVINATKQRLCAVGDQAILSGPAGFNTYVWSTGATTPTIIVTEGGVYSVKVTSGSGCISESSDNFTVDLGAQKPTILAGSTELASSPAKTYQWFFGDVAIPNQTKQFLKYNPLQYGVYKVAVTDLSDCAATSDPFINLVTGAEDHSKFADVYPNPVTSALFISKAVDEASLHDVTGKLLQVLATGENDVTHLSKGIYVVRVKSGLESKTIKITK